MRSQLRDRIVRVYLYLFVVVNLGWGFFSCVCSGEMRAMSSILLCYPNETSVCLIEGYSVEHLNDCNLLEYVVTLLKMIGGRGRFTRSIIYYIMM
jgi:hypothetical protein